jgi:hypothetical protein
MGGGHPGELQEPSAIRSPVSTRKLGGTVLSHRILLLLVYDASFYDTFSYYDAWQISWHQSTALALKLLLPLWHIPDISIYFRYPMCIVITRGYSGLEIHGGNFNKCH